MLLFNFALNTQLFEEFKVLMLSLSQLLNTILST